MMLVMGAKEMCTTSTFDCIGDAITWLLFTDLSSFGIRYNARDTDKTVFDRTNSKININMESAHKYSLANANQLPSLWCNVL